MFFDQTRTKSIIQYHYNTSYLLFVIFLDERYWIYFSLDMLYNYFTNFFKWHKHLSVVKTYTFFTFLIMNKHVLNLTLLKEIHLFLEHQCRWKHDFFFFFINQLIQSIKNVFFSMSNYMFDFSTSTSFLQSNKELTFFDIKMDVIEEKRFFFYYTYKSTLDFFFEHFVCFLSPCQSFVSINLKDTNSNINTNNTYQLKSLFKKVILLITKKKYTDWENSFFFKGKKEFTFFNSSLFYRLLGSGKSSSSSINIKKIIRLLLFHYNKLLNKQQMSMFNFIYNKVSMQVLSSQFKTYETFNISKYFILQHQKKYSLVVNKINKDMCAHYLK